MRSAVIVLSGALGIGAVSPSAAADDDKQACVSAYEHAQVLKREGKLRASREKLRMCARDVCPALVRNDCIAWLDQVDRALPSVVIEAKRDDADLTVAKVTLDGNVVSQRLDGKAIELEAGEHVVKVETEGGAPMEQTIVVREGEKNRLVSFAYKTKKGPDDEGYAPPGAVVPAERPVPIGVWPLAALGVVGVGAFAVLGSLGSNDEQNLRSTCAPSCAHSDADSVHTKFILADISLGIGAASLVGAAIWYLARPTAAAKEKDDTGPMVTAGPRGGSVGFRARF